MGEKNKVNNNNNNNNSNGNSNNLKLKLKSGEVIEISPLLVKFSSVLAEKLEEYKLTGKPVSTDSKIDKKTFEQLEIYYKFHQHDRPLTIDDLKSSMISEWDNRFFPNDPTTLVNYVMAGQDFKFESFLEISCRLLAIWMKGKDVDIVRKHLKIVEDFDPAKETERLEAKRFAMRRHEDY